MTPAEAPIHVRARFDGRAFVPETPVDVAEGTVVELWGATAPNDQSRPKPRFGSARGLIEMRNDFDDPVPGFEDYT